MRQSPLLSGIIYILLGVLFVFFAVQNVNEEGGWGFFSYLLVILATFDLGSGLRIIWYHFRVKDK
nr:YdiK family protein [uncultured Bacillus sp.]